MNQENTIPKTYDPNQSEGRIYKDWMEKGYFKGDVQRDKNPFCIVIPPPNITGQLHMGHALDNSIQDILIRWRRMKGYATLWMPGTDHASIATEVRIVEGMAEEGLTKNDVGREGFLERAWDWKEKYGGRIVEQLKRLGASADWSRKRFTMDEGCSEAVKEAFVNLYEKGLIYQGDRIINWCPDCKTALSDAEVEHVEQDGHFWHILYPIKNSSEFLTIATTRPETMLGDTAVAVHPDDERYSSLIGKTVLLPLVNREIPVISDEYVDREFGTGVVKITPAHDPNDFEVGMRHNLEILRVIDDGGTMNENAGSYKGLDRYDARKKILKDLEGLNLLTKTEDHVHNVGHCYRCDTIVEPIISKQWFVKMEPLAKPAIEVVKKGQVKFIPERYEKTYFNWMENIRDWCISRQLWWGHRIPAYYCEDCGETIVSKDRPHSCPNCSGRDLKQDEDVLDTWFSSALWPFSTLGWPENTEELQYFYPTSVLVTAYDIIFFWVARMIFSGIEHMDEIPFKHVFIHGIVRDSLGRKMSKSLGNGIDPLEIIDEYGADALRLSLVTGNSPGNDMRFYTEKVEASRNFANKIWNASRFIMMNLHGDNPKKPPREELELSDRWILSKFNRLVSEVDDNLEKYELGIAVQKLNDFLWNEFCDWYIELVKPRLYEKDGKERETALYMLIHILSNSLKLLHPFMPFITEEIWQHLPHEGDSIMVSPWPIFRQEDVDEESEEEMDAIMDAIRSIRNTRAQMEVGPSKKAQVFILASKGFKEVFEGGQNYFQRLAYASGVTIVDSEREIPQNSVSAVSDKAQIFMPMGDLVDFNKEIERLDKEKEGITKEIDRAQGKLSNKNFLEKAPDRVVSEEKDKLLKYNDMLEKIEDRIRSLNKMIEDH